MPELRDPLQALLPPDEPRLPEPPP